MSRDPPKREPYAPLHQIDARGSEAPVKARATPAPAHRTALPMPRPTGQTLEPAVEQEPPPSITPQGVKQRSLTAVSAVARTLTGGPINEAVAYAVLYILLFVLFVAFSTVSCTSTYTIGHGWFGFFGCPNEVLVVQPYEGPTMKETLKQEGR